MHVAPPDLRALRQHDLVIRFAMLGSIAFVLAEIPEGGSAGTALERPSSASPWGLVIAGEMTYVGDGPPVTIPAGHAFHVPAGGGPHFFRASGGSRIAGFQPIDPDTDVSDPGLTQQGFEVFTPPPNTNAYPTFAFFIDDRPPVAGAIEARSWAMPPQALTAVRFGRASGYTADWCDAPHWGLVSAGQLVIEYEHDVEILTAGDVYHCPGGAPAHRFQAADPASIIDLTPISAIIGQGRVAGWRRTALSLADQAEERPISVVSLR
jgi:quercetin dioxygenase-like cupin family protein